MAKILNAKIRCPDLLNSSIFASKPKLRVSVGGLPIRCYDYGFRHEYNYQLH